MADEQNQTQETAVATTQTVKTMQLSEKGGLQLTGLADMFRFAQYVAASGLAPKGMEKPEQIIIALELGYEVGLPPMNAIQNIAVINGRPSLWGDAMLALVRSSGKMKKYKEEEIGTPWNDDYGFRITSVRKSDDPDGEPEELITTFTIAKAKTAGLWKKAGPWTFYPDRMLKMRARSFNLRDLFPDVLKGMFAREEAMDMPPREAEYEVVETKPISRTDTLASKLGVKQEEVKTETPAAPEKKPEPEPEKKPVVVPEKKPAPEVKTEAPVSEPLSTEKKPFGEYVLLSAVDYAALLDAYGNPMVEDTIDQFNSFLGENPIQRKKDHKLLIEQAIIKKQENPTLL